MDFVFYVSDKEREIMLAAALGAGLKNLNHSYEIRRTDQHDGRTDADVAVFFGVKGGAILDDYLCAGRHTVMLDKGYTRDKGSNGHTKYTRAIIDGSSPARYMMSDGLNGDRFSRLGLTIEARKPATKDGFVLFCESTEKYHKFHGLDEPGLYAKKIIGKIRKLTDRPVVRRQKKAAAGRPATISEALRGCHLLVTHGSSAAMDAVLAGVPAVTLGEGIASPVSACHLEDIDRPFYPDAELLRHWANAMAYCQWTVPEIHSGEAISHWLSTMEMIK